MKFSSTILPEGFLNKAAFALLSSSSVHRYVRIAKSLATSSPLRSNLDSNKVTVQHLIEYAQELWSEALSQKQRGISEVELAVIVSTLSETSLEEVDELLIRMAILDSPPISWIAALARQLCQERVSNQDQKVAALAVESQEVYFRSDQQTDMWLFPADNTSILVSPTDAHADDRLVSFAV